MSHRALYPMNHITLPAEEDPNPRLTKTELRQSFMLRYGCAVVSIALATIVRLLLDPLLGDHIPFSMLLFAVLLTAWYGGVRPRSVKIFMRRAGST